jgi:hypothetical protein
MNRTLKSQAVLLSVLVAAGFGGSSSWGQTHEAAKNKFSEAQKKNAD